MEIFTGMFGIASAREDTMSVCSQSRRCVRSSNFNVLSRSLPRLVGRAPIPNEDKGCSKEVRDTLKNVVAGSLQSIHRFSFEGPRAKSYAGQRTNVSKSVLCFLLRDRFECGFPNALFNLKDSYLHANWCTPYGRAWACTSCFLFRNSFMLV